VVGEILVVVPPNYMPLIAAGLVGAGWVSKADSRDMLRFVPGVLLVMAWLY
jgi:hypothetical protein